MIASPVVDGADLQTTRVGGAVVAPKDITKLQTLTKLNTECWRVVASYLASLVLLLAAACGTATTTSGTEPPPRASSVTMIEYVGGHWVPFTSVRALNQSQWAVVDAYANFSSAALAVYTTRSVAPLATVVSAQSKVTSMFTRDLATGKNPEALYSKATVESVAIHGCRASITLELYYPGGRSLHYVSSWVRPFDRTALAHAKQRAAGQTSSRGNSLAALATTQYAPWQFVGDNRVGGVDTPCGI